MPPKDRKYQKDLLNRYELMTIKYRLTKINEPQPQDSRPNIQPKPTTGNNHLNK